MKKTFDAVELMRKARAKMTEEWKEKPHAEQISYLREKYARLTTRKIRPVAG
jgi:hypothetical protein